VNLLQMRLRRSQGQGRKSQVGEKRPVPNPAFRDIRTQKVPGDRGNGGLATVASFRTWRDSQAATPQPLTRATLRGRSRDATRFWVIRDHSVRGDESSNDEHAVAVGIEAVAFTDCLVVGLQDELAIGKGADEHEEGAFGQMKVGEEGIDHLELVGWVDENVSAPLGGFERGRVAAEVFEGAGDGRPDGDDSLGGIDLCGRVSAEVVVLLMHTVLQQVVHRNGSERSDADVKGEEGMRVPGE
jgi:hypothetical protein